MWLEEGPTEVQAVVEAGPLEVLRQAAAEVMPELVAEWQERFTQWRQERVTGAVEEALAKGIFLLTLEIFGGWMVCCRLLRLDPRRVLVWLKQDRQFAEGWMLAEQSWSERLELRGAARVSRPDWHRDPAAAMIWARLLKGWRGLLYRDNAPPTAPDIPQVSVLFDEMRNPYAKALAARMAPSLLEDGDGDADDTAGPGE